MARLARVVAPGLPHHITQRGNRRQPTFFSDEDDQYYLQLMAEWCAFCSVEIWANCLMPNHVHLIAVPQSADGLTRAIGDVLHRYTRMVNFREGWRGHLWQGRFSSFVLDEGFRHPACLDSWLSAFPPRLVERLEQGCHEVGCLASRSLAARLCHVAGCAARTNPASPRRARVTLTRTLVRVRFGIYVYGVLVLSSARGSDPFDGACELWHQGEVRCNASGCHDLGGRFVFSHPVRSKQPPGAEILRRPPKSTVSNNTPYRSRTTRSRRNRRPPPSARRQTGRRCR